MARRKEIRRKDIPKQKPTTPVQTPKQAAEVARQRKDREARGQVPAGPGQEFVPPRAKLTAEVRRVDTREEVAGMEDRPDVVAPELTADVEAGRLRGESIWGADVGLAEGFAYSAAAGTAIGLAVYAGVELATNLGARALISRAAAGQVAKKTVQTTLTGGRIATNTVTAAKTYSWLTRIGIGLKNPTVAASTLLGIIGSYPFAGFIQEEALQTLSFAVNTATKNDDAAGAEAALQAQAEVLDPGVWTQIIQSVPYSNLAIQLRKFYKAARVKLEIDARAVDKMKEAQEPERPGVLIE